MTKNLQYILCAVILFAMKKSTTVQKEYFDLTDGTPEKELLFDAKWQTDFHFPCFPISVTDVIRTDGIYIQHQNYHGIAIEMVLEGKITYTVNRKKYKALPGTVFVIVPHSNVRIENASPGCLRRKINLLISGNSKEMLCNAVGFLSDTMIKPRDPNEIERKIRRIGAIIRQNGSRKQAALLTYELMLSLKLEQKKKSTSTKINILEFKNYIRENMQSKLTVSTLAETVGVSPQKLHRIVKENAGCSPSELCNQIRIERAAILLQCTEMTIKNIVFECGYNYPAYFGKIFKEYYGLSPVEYRFFTRKNAVLNVKLEKQAKKSRT